MRRHWRRFMGVLIGPVLIASAPGGVLAAWEPTKPIEFVIPAGTGGGADQMARLIAGLAEKHKLSPAPSSWSTSRAGPAPRGSCT